MRNVKSVSASGVLEEQLRAAQGHHGRGSKTQHRRSAAAAHGGEEQHGREEAQEVLDHRHQ